MTERDSCYVLLMDTAVNFAAGCALRKAAECLHFLFSEATQLCPSVNVVIYLSVYVSMKAS